MEEHRNNIETRGGERVIVRGMRAEKHIEGERKRGMRSEKHTKAERGRDSVRQSMKMTTY